MLKICKLYLVRHGESEANRDNLVGGHKDTPLTQRGREQALETKQLLRNVHFDITYSSDLLRASQTAAIISGRPVTDGHQLFDLRERSFGKLEGQAAETEWFEINRQYEEKYGQLPFEERWQHNLADFIEGDKVLYERFSKALLQISKQNRGKTVLVVSHGGPIRILLMKLHYANLLTAGAFKNAGYIELMSRGDTFEIIKVVGVETTSSAE